MPSVLLIYHTALRGSSAKLSHHISNNRFGVNFCDPVISEPTRGDYEALR